MGVRAAGRGGAERGAPRVLGARGRRILVALLLAATVLGALATQRNVHADQRARFGYEVARIDGAVEERMRAYVQVLRGGLGLFQASDEVTRADWRRYVDTLRLRERYPGFKSLSYAVATPRAGLPALVRRVRAEPAPPGTGTAAAPNPLARYALRAPRGSRGVPPVHAPIVWVAPFTPENRAVLGVDMMREPVRRATMLRARSTGDAVLSPRLRLSGSTDRAAGFIAYVPVTVRGRHAGWLTAAFLADGFMRGLLAGAGSPLRFEVSDATGARLWSSAGTVADGAPRALGAATVAGLRATSRVAMPGTRWRVRYVATGGLVTTRDRLAPWLVALGGLVATFLFWVAARASAGWHRAAGRAEAATRAKSAFLATMTHEIRTPMNAVIGTSSSLLETRMTAEQAEHAAVIRESAEHLLHLVNDILDFSKIEAGRIALEEAPFALAMCVESAVALVAGDARAKRVRLTHEIEDGVPAWVLGDVSRLRQVLLNLLANAVKFTPEGGTVAIRATAGPAGVVLAVRDTGIGMTQAQQERLFEPFTQADPSTARRFGGTGLGLSIAGRIVAAMGGTIAVDSQLGAGATFRVTVPLAAVPAPGPAPDPVAPEAADMAARRPLRILVAEDHSVNQLVARRTFARLGYAVDVVGNGEEAVAAVERQAYDAVFLDIRMPVMDGLDAARVLRRRWPGAACPRLVAVTANVWEEDREAARAAGMDDVLAKPVTIERLVAVLERCERVRTTLRALAEPGEGAPRC